MTKIDIFSGFLGAGKTTLIKKLIAEAYTGEQLVLIENEFGEIGIDGGFLQEAGINITEMNSGCICCSLVGDFGKALEKEARAILTAVPKGSSLAALCVEGKQKTSEELAAYLDERAGSGAGDVAFVIGSSHGLADSVKQTASLRLSMSKMTFPHQLARVMLLEQLYRAFSINHGGKYHK